MPADVLTRRSGARRPRGQRPVSDPAGRDARTRASRASAPTRRCGPSCGECSTSAASSSSIPPRFELAYQELELALFEGRQSGDGDRTRSSGSRSTPRRRRWRWATDSRWCEATSSPMHRPRRCGETARSLMCWSVFTLAVEGSGGHSVISLARARFRRVLTALRLFERAAMRWARSAWTRTTRERGGRSRLDRAGVPGCSP